PRLDFDDAGAHVGQEHRAEGHRDDLPQVQYRDVAQGLVHVPSMAAKPAPPRRYCDARAGPVNPLGRFVLEPAGRMPGSVEAGDSIESCTPRHFHGADMELTPKRYMDTVVLSP